jgi:hypothetical protein
MREEMMHELETNQPDYLIYVDVWDSWGERNGMPQAAGFLEWLQDFRTKNYERVGVADILEHSGKDQTQYIWGDNARTYVTKSSQVIYLLKKKQVPDFSFADIHRPGVTSDLAPSKKSVHHCPAKGNPGHTTDNSHNFFVFWILTFKSFALRILPGISCLS